MMMQNIKNTTEETILEDKDIREGLMERVDVLDKVKHLLLMPRLDLVTAQYIADFYEVDVKAIRKIVDRHKDELESDGMVKVSRRQVLERLPLDVANAKIYKTHIEMVVEDTTFKIANRAGWMFPRRAILRVGMLLRDSKIAKEVRNQLLNIEEKVQIPEKVKDIDTELNLLGQALVESFMQEDMDSFVKTTMKIDKYKNRHKDEVIESLKKENQELNRKVKTLSLDVIKLSDSEVYRECAMGIVNRIRVAKEWPDNYLILRELYTILRNKHNINLNIRAYAGSINKSKIDCIKIEEWPIAFQILTGLAYKYNADIRDFLLQLERKQQTA